MHHSRAWSQRGAQAITASNFCATKQDTARDAVAAIPKDTTDGHCLYGSSMIR
ncbi:hypothetical protein INT45_000133 [Circinella minor]|uniref:Uncharacterized protein n=1 Tax=Circinella minor TaxID=1195481 RepID=A0A8H7S8S5_9FUNG|nr:hypothetical protein INT45_000133 [Circinella minor]